MTSLQPAEREVKTTDSRSYLMRILPYRTSEDHINGLVLTFVDITARKEAEEAVRVSEAQMRAMFTQARAGVAQADLQGGYTMVNQRYRSLLGYSESELLGKNMADFVYSGDCEAHRDELRDLLDKGKPFESEKRYVCKDNSIVWLHNSITRINNRHGKPQSVLTISIDITQQKAAEQQKDEFISIASHELKTPVTSIKAYAGVLREKFRRAGDTGSEAVMAKLDGQVDRMAHLINDLLDTTSLTGGRLQLHKSDFDLKELIAETAEVMQYTAQKQKLELQLNPLPPYNGDRERIGQILVNLMSNAVKYGPASDKVIINASASATDIRICVQDFGKGLSEDAMGRVFERFYRADGVAKTFPGMGLGLYISAELAKMHGGTISVESALGKGTTFCLVLPLLQS